MIVNVAIFHQLKYLSIDAIVEISHAFLELALGVKIFFLSDVGLILHAASHQSILFLYELLKFGYCSYVSEYFSILRKGKLH